MEWILIIHLYAGFGKDTTPTTITGETVYPSELECIRQAVILGNWLTQDGVKFRYVCAKQLKTAKE